MADGDRNHGHFFRHNFLDLVEKRGTFLRVRFACLIGKELINAFFEIGRGGLLIWLPNKLQLKNFAQFFCLGIFLLLAVAMSNHLVPGFNNLSIFKKIQFSTEFKLPEFGI